MVRRVVSQGALVHTHQRLIREVENVRRACTLRKTTRRSASVRTEPSEAEKKKEMTSAVLVRNGRELVEDEREENGAKKKSAVPAAGAWLASARRGAYTTARSVDVKSVFEFETHVTRLAESARLMYVSFLPLFFPSINATRISGQSSSLSRALSVSVSVSVCLSLSVSLCLSLLMMLCVRICIYSLYIYPEAM